MIIDKYSIDSTVNIGDLLVKMSNHEIRIIW